VLPARSQVRAGLIASGRDSTFQNKVHLTMQAKGFFDQVDDGKE